MDDFPTRALFVSDRCSDVFKPSIRHEYLLSGLFPQPRGPPRVAAIGNDVMAGKAHQVEIEKRIEWVRMSEYFRVAGLEYLLTPRRIIRENKKACVRDALPHPVHRSLIIIQAE